MEILQFSQKLYKNFNILLLFYLSFISSIFLFFLFFFFKSIKITYI